MAASRWQQRVLQWLRLGRNMALPAMGLLLLQSGVLAARGDSIQPVVRTAANETPQELERIQRLRAAVDPVAWAIQLASGVPIRETEVVPGVFARAEVRSYDDFTIVWRLAPGVDASAVKLVHAADATSLQVPAARIAGSGGRAVREWGAPDDAGVASLRAGAIADRDAAGWAELRAPIVVPFVNYTVTNTNDSGSGSLRQALTSALGAGVGPHVITISATGTINLQSALPIIENISVSINGPGADSLTINRSGGGGYSIFQTPNILYSRSYGFSGMRIRNGLAGFSGGGLNITGGTLTLNQVSITDNSSASSGGGLSVAHSSVTISDSTFSGNSTGLQGSAINAQAALLTITNTTFSGNQATNPSGIGGAIFHFSSATQMSLINCTFAGNTAPEGRVQALRADNLALFRNTVFSGPAPQIGGNGASSLGNNLSSDSSYLGVGELQNTDALLSALGNYGGPTPTHALLPGSPAINAGASNLAPTADQRGIARVGNVDIGAFESRGFTLTRTSGNAQTTNVNTAFPAPLVATVSSSVGEPVQGGVVSFSAPGSGASASLGSGSATIAANGTASTSATANAVAGSYTVGANANGNAGAPLSYGLTNAGLPSLSIADASVAEGDSGTRLLQFTATLDHPVPGGFTVNYATSDGTATTADNDYVAATGLLSFAGTAGESRTFNVTIHGDTRVEANETFTVSMNTVSNATVVISDTATGTITNDDHGMLSMADLTLPESGPFTFAVTLSAATGAPFSVDWSFAAGTTVAADFVGGVFPTGGTLNFSGSAGESQTFTVPVLDDTLVEPTETFGVGLANLITAGGFTLDIADTAVGTIIDNDVAADFDVTTTATGITVTDTNSNGSTLIATEPMAEALRLSAPGRTFSVNGAAPTADSGTLSLAGITSISIDAPGGVAVATGEVFNIGVATFSSTSAITLAGGRLRANGNATVNAPLLLTADSDLAQASSGANLTLAGAISGDFTLRTALVGVYRFASTASTFARLNITAGTVLLLGDNTLPPEIDITSTARLELNGFSQSIDALSGFGLLQNTGAAATLTLGVAGSASSFGAATYAGNISGPINLRVASGGNQTLGSNLSSYTGTTEVLGTLRVTGSNALGAAGPGNSTRVAGTLQFANVAYAAQEAVTIDGGTLRAVTGGPSSFPGPISLAGGVVDIIADDTLLLSGVIDGTRGFIKSGSSSLTLSATSTYSGTTLVQTGALLVTGSISSGVQVLGTLGGTGTVNGGIGLFSSGRLEPGLSPGILTANGSVNLTGNTTFAVEIEGATPGTQYDQLVAAQEVSLGNATLALSGSFVPSVGQSFTIIDHLGSAPNDFTFNGRPEGSVALFNGVYLRISYVGGDGNDVVLTAVAPTVSIDDVSANEGQSGSTDYVFTVTLSLPAPAAGVTFDIATADGSAQDGAPPGEDQDYFARSLTSQTIPAGASTYSFTVQVIGDQVAEPDETFFVNLSNVIGALVTRGQGQGTIVNDDGVPAVTLVQSNGSTEVTEGGSTDSYTLVLTSQPTANVILTITPDAQLSTSVPTLSFTPLNWATPQAVTVSAVDDAVVEGSHSGTIAHSASGGGYTAVTIADVTVTITDNDSAGVTIVQSEGGTAVTEGGATDSFTVVLTSQPGAAVNISLTGTEVSVVPSPLSFTAANWNVAQTVTVTAIDDAVVEGPHTGSVMLALGSSDSDYADLAVTPVSVAITDNDSATLSIADTQVLEGATGTVALEFTVSLSAAVVGGVSVPFNTADGTAHAGSDYQSRTGTLSFNGTAGETRIASVLVNGDNILESDETLLLQLGEPNSPLVSLSRTQATGTIRNDDSASVSTAPVVQAEGDSGTTHFSFVLQLAGQVQDGFTLRAQTRDDSALAGSDYSAADLNLNFDDSLNASRTVIVGVHGDVEPEALERFFLDLSSSTAGLSITPASVAAEIVNDDLFADLSLSNTRLPGPVSEGTVVEYEVIVRNLSTVVDVPAAQFVFSVSPTLSEVAWMCVAASGSSCPPSGTGLPSHNIALEAASSVIYRIQATVRTGTEPADLVGSTATITLNAPYSDPDNSNNSATAGSNSLTDRLFRDGFEPAIANGLLHINAPQP